MDDEGLLRREDQALSASCRSPANRNGGAWPKFEEAAETLAGRPLRARARFGWRHGAGGQRRAQKAGEGRGEACMRSWWPEAEGMAAHEQNGSGGGDD
jgi:hypothetical protein